jgi:integrase
MARPAKGTILEHATKDGRVTRTLRFYVNGQRQRVTLGVVSREEAERQLAYAMADVARGEWRPPQPPRESPGAAPTFHDYADDWWELRKPDLAPNTQADYQWRLEVHLIDYFGAMPLTDITPTVVKRYIADKLREDKPLSARSINMTLMLLGAILEHAVEDELIARNPARGKRARERAPVRSTLESAEHIAALLDAAGELDRAARPDRQHVERRAMIATLTFAGLRIGELLALRWRDVDLASGWLTVGESKTPAGRRRVKVRGALRDELLAVRTRQEAEPGCYVFSTSSGCSVLPENFRNRVLAPAVKRANENLAAQGGALLPPKLTPHSLRRTFCSLLYALGESPPIVMAEMGHTGPSLALRIYAQAIRRSEAEQAALGALVDGSRAPAGGEFRPIGADEAESGSEAPWSASGAEAENGSVEP